MAESINAQIRGQISGIVGHGDCHRMLDAVATHHEARHSIRIGALPPLSVGDYLGGFVSNVHAEASAVGLADYLQRRITTLGPDLRVALCLSTLRHTPEAPRLLVSCGISAASPQLRHQIAEEISRLAARGTEVFWAEHDVNTLWSVADHITEVADGQVLSTAPTTSWQVRTLAPPTLATLARWLRQPLSSSKSPASFREATATAPTTPDMPARRRTKAQPQGSPVAVVPADAGFRGRTIGFRAGECLGLVNLSGRAEPLARRIIEALAGHAVSSHLPPHERDVSHVTHPVWLPHPQVGLNPSEQHALATQLAGNNAGPRLITTHDIEFLVRACHRIAIVENDLVRIIGSPYAVAPHLPDLPVVARALGSTQFLRLSDLAPEAP